MSSIRESDLPLIDFSSAKDDLVRRITDSVAEFGCFWEVLRHKNLKKVCDIDKV